MRSTCLELYLSSAIKYSTIFTIESLLHAKETESTAIHTLSHHLLQEVFTIYRKGRKQHNILNNVMFPELTHSIKKNTSLVIPLVTFKNSCNSETDGFIFIYFAARKPSRFCSCFFFFFCQPTSFCSSYLGNCNQSYDTLNI